jgi:putative 4-mercaptohistidine N1-methyltranferase
MPPNPYETDRLLAEYLLFHYGTEAELLPWPFGPREALDFPVRSVTGTFEPLPPEGRALDLGCAVGRSSFELARHCRAVVGIDFSHRFIEAARALQQHGVHPYERIDEGVLTTPLLARVPAGIDRSRVQFETGDATHLRPDLGLFDAVLAANLLCRLPDPRRCLARLPSLVKPGGQLVLTTPMTWMDDYTPREQWLGGYERKGQRIATLDGIREMLEPAFELIRTTDLPLLIREHTRKYQWTVTQASLWRRRP